jgi:phosphoglycerate dehydrogenase-like enzyme
MTEGWKQGQELTVAVSGIPRGYHYPAADGNWLLPHHLEQIHMVAPGIRLVEIPAARKVSETDIAAMNIEVLLGEGGNREHYPGELDWEDYLQFFTPSLRWIQLCSTGFSDNITPEVLSGKVVLTNAPGLHTVPIAESVMMAMLQHAKNLPARLSDQKVRNWNQLKNKELFRSTVLILGLGRIGRETARLCKAFGMEVLGTKRNMGAVANVDIVFAPEDLNLFLPRADFIVMALPITAETKEIINAQSFRFMKNTSYLINIGRGQTLDEAALVRALNSHAIAGAYLDAFSQEPLPAEHPLWQAENCTIVPHDSHSSPYIGDRMVDIFCKNLQLYVDGEPLENICDPYRGY